jgi:hypothetical protein
MQFKRRIVYERGACFTVPANLDDVVKVVDGNCT